MADPKPGLKGKLGGCTGRVWGKYCWKFDVVVNFIRSKIGLEVIDMDKSVKSRLKEDLFLMAAGFVIGGIIYGTIKIVINSLTF